MNKVLGRGKVCALLFLTSKGAVPAPESGICSVHRLFLDPESREFSWTDSSLPVCRNKREIRLLS